MRILRTCKQARTRVYLEDQTNVDPPQRIDEDHCCLFELSVQDVLVAYNATFLMLPGLELDTCGLPLSFSISVGRR